MRIVYLHQYFNTPQMSGSTRSYEMARRLVAWGHQVDMITSQCTAERHAPTGWTQTEEGGIRVHWLPVPYDNAMSYPDRLRAFARFAIGAARKAASLPADVVFATSTPLTIALPGVVAARRQRVPMVFEVRDLWPQLPIAIGALRGKPLIWAARWLERWAYHHSAQIVALSPGMKDGITRTGFPEDRVHVIPNSADLELFAVPPALGQQFRQRHAWLQDRPLVIYSGALGRINGVSYLAHLAAELRKRMPEARFLVMGNGAETEKVRQVARQLGVLDTTFFMLDALPKVEIPAVLSAADIATSLFVNMPEMWANSANKFFDALASGTPPAINYLGWQAEIIEESEAGLVLHPQDMGKAADRLFQALSDPQWLERAGRAASRLAEERFSREHLARQLEAVLLGALRD